VNAALRAWYRHKRVFVTGHTGFKGAWLTTWLQDVGARVTGFALAPEQQALTACGSGMSSIVGDVRDQATLEKAICEAEPEIFFHLAAQSLVRRSYADPVGTYSTNVMGTVHVLETLRRVSSIRAIVIVASDKCYSQDEASPPFRENDPLGGRDPYSSSKAAAELVTSAFSESFFTGLASVASARAGNVIGGGDWAEDRLLPDLMKAAVNEVPAVIRRAESVRPWQYVLEPLRGYLMLGRALVEGGKAFAGAWNFGPSPADELSVRDVVRHVSAAWDRVRARYEPDYEGPYEAPFLSLDSSKARDGLGWIPLLTATEALMLTTSWYRDCFERAAKPDELVREHLRRYEQRVDLAERVL
jgi:CDP-glucose 4,6-dehydratase